MEDANEFLTLLRTFPGGEPTSELIERSRAFIQGAMSDHAAALPWSTEALRELPLPGAAWLVVCFGGLAENERTDESLASAVVEYLRKVVGPFAEISDNDGELAAADVHNLDRLCQGVVSVLAANPETRNKSAHDTELLSQLDLTGDLATGPLWVSEALTKRSGRLLLLAPKSGQGVETAYENVSNAFHLFSFIQAKVGGRIRGGKRPKASVLAALAPEPAEIVGDSACWHFGHPNSSTPEFMASIWGEGSVDQIPTIDGLQVILLWPMLVAGRSWDTSFFGPHLDRMPAHFEVVRNLPQPEVASWLDRLGIPQDMRPKKGFLRWFQ